MKRKDFMKSGCMFFFLLFLASVGVLFLPGLSGAGHPGGVPDGGPAAASPVPQEGVIASPERSLGEFLLPDGTFDLKRGFKGALDARGFRLASGPGEAPRFESVQAPDDIHWAGGFHVPGVTTWGDVFAVVSDESGNLYVGGGFTEAGGFAVNNIAKWDGTNWAPLGKGLADGVYAIAMDKGGKLYAATRGDQGGSEYSNIVRWNGARWFSVSGRIYGRVNSLAVDSQGNLYAGGSFTKMVGVAAKHIAKWDGTHWSPLGNGMNRPVYALTLASNGTLYAAGAFDKAGGVIANRIAKWNGKKWSPLGSGMSGKVYALTVDSSGNLYAGGKFTEAGGVAANSIAKWNGRKWSPLGSGITSPNRHVHEVYAVVVDSSGNLYAGGHFTQAGGVAANYIAKWDGTKWSPLGSGTQYCTCYSVFALAQDSNGILYAGGHFTEAGGRIAFGIAKWDGGSWSHLGEGNGITGDNPNDVGVNALALDSSGNLYAGGRFTEAGGVVANNVAKWDGTGWSPLGSGITDGWSAEVFALAVDSSGNLYAGGEFTRAGGVAASGIAKWDGASWSPLGSGIGGVWVFALAVDSSGNLYVGGNFSRAGGVTVSNIAKWDGTSWSPLGEVTNVSYYVHALAVDSNGNVYAGGRFSGIGGVAANYIAKWDGTSWSPLGSGMDGLVSALAVDSSGNLYAGGEFTRAGGVAASNIAKWDGTSWSPLGSGMNGSVSALAVDGNGNVWAGGNCTEAGGVAANNIAKWDGTSWSPLGSGVGVPYSDPYSQPQPQARALGLDGNGNLWVGGQFNTAGGKASSNIALWVE